MARSLHQRLPAVLVASVAASALAASPALATEGPTAPPPASFPNLAPPTFALPGAATPATSASIIRKARIVPRRVRRGRRATLRVSLTTPSRLRVVMARRSGGRYVRVRTIAVPARGRAVSLRLPARKNGHRLRAGRYRVSVTSVDALGKRSQPVRVTLTVRKRAS
jgi:hypothetical protein